VGAFGVFAQGDLFETVENRTYGVAHGVVRALGKVWGAIVTVPRCGPTQNRRELLAGFNSQEGKEARANLRIRQRFPAKHCVRTDRAGASRSSVPPPAR